MKLAEPPREVPLSEAAQRLGLTWPKAHARLLRGDLRGRKHEGRWLVDLDSVEAAERTREGIPGAELEPLTEAEWTELRNHVRRHALGFPMADISPRVGALLTAVAKELGC